MFLQNILFIPCIIELAVSGIKLSNIIIRNRTNKNIKLEILRHTFLSFFILIVLIISSLIEVYISKNILIFILKYI